MAYMVERDVNAYGYLVGGDELLPTKTAFHDWTQPYPKLSSRLSLEWDRGDLGVLPDVFTHNRLRDWVCDERALDVLMEMASGDLHVIGQGNLESIDLTIIQAIAVVDAVDEAASEVDVQETYRLVTNPVLFRDADRALARRIFRVPSPGLSLKVFVGDEVKRVFEESAVTGLTFVSVDLTA